MEEGKQTTSRIEKGDVKLLKELEHTLGFTLRPLKRIYGMFFLSYAGKSKPSELEWIEIRTPEDLFLFVDTFYTATLLYYRALPLVNRKYLKFDDEPFVFAAKDIEGYERLVKLEVTFLEIVKNLETSMNTNSIVRWNERTKEACKRLSQLKGHGRESIQLSEFFRDEIITRVDFYKIIRDDLAKSLNFDIRGFSQLHKLFVQYYNTMKFFDMNKYAAAAAKEYESYSGDESYKLEVDDAWYYKQGEWVDDDIIKPCQYDEWNERNHKSQQEYFFAVKEYYKEVIKYTLKIVDRGLYSDLQKKDLLQYMTEFYLYDLVFMEHLWYPYLEGSTTTWKYDDFYEEKFWPRKITGIENYKQFLVELYDFITKNPWYGHEHPSIGKDFYLVLLGLKKLRS